MPAARKGNSEYVKLEQRLVLPACLNSLFGCEKNRLALILAEKSGE